MKEFHPEVEDFASHETKYVKFVFVNLQDFHFYF